MILKEKIFVILAIFLLLSPFLFYLSMGGDAMDISMGVFPLINAFGWFQSFISFGEIFSMNSGYVPLNPRYDFLQLFFILLLWLSIPIMIFVTKGIKNVEQSGTGLGLFLCKGIVQAHGGEITAQNKFDVGAIFEFSIPILQKNKIMNPSQLSINKKL